MVALPPLTGLKVLEFAGLAPGPFAGLLLADAGASVLRVDRPEGMTTTSSSSPSGATDQLTRHKASVAVDLKTAAGRRLALRLAREADVLIEPFRPGVMERLGLGPEVFLGRAGEQGEGENPRLVYGRLTGFRRDGRYAHLAGHDINYLAVSGVLDMLGRAGGGRPAPPVNILGDFAGGGAVLVQGILMALLARGGGVVTGTGTGDRSGTVMGRGQVVEANMVDGAGYLATHPRLALKTSLGGGGPPGTNLLDGGCPYYDTYRTRDGKYVAVGALEPRFFALLVRGLGLEGQGWEARRGDRGCWGDMRRVFEGVFAGRTRGEWEGVFEGVDACCTPVLEYGELEEGAGRGRGREGDQRPVVTLRGTPCLAVDTGAAGSAAGEDDDEVGRGQGPGVPGDGYVGRELAPGEGGDERLREWLGWERGREFDVGEGGGLVLKTVSKL